MTQAGILSFLLIMSYWSINYIVAGCRNVLLCGICAGHVSGRREVEHVRAPRPLHELSLGPGLQISVAFINGWSLGDVAGFSSPQSISGVDGGQGDKASDLHASQYMSVVDPRWD